MANLPVRIGTDETRGWLVRGIVCENQRHGNVWMRSGFELSVWAKIGSLWKRCCSVGGPSAYSNYPD